MDYSVLYEGVETDEDEEKCRKMSAGKTVRRIMQEKKCRKTAYRKTVCRIMQERFNVLQFSRAGEPCTSRERYAA